MVGRPFLLYTLIGWGVYTCSGYVYFNGYIINEILENKNSDAISILTGTQGKRYTWFLSQTFKNQSIYEINRNIEKT